LLQFAGKFLGENWGNSGGGSWQGNGASGRGAWQEWQQLTTSLVHICGFVCRKTERAAEQEHLAKWLNGPKVKGERLKGGRWPGRNMLRIIIESASPSAYTVSICPPPIPQFWHCAIN